MTEEIKGKLSKQIINTDADSTVYRTSLNQSQTKLRKIGQNWLETTTRRDARRD